MDSGLAWVGGLRGYSMLVLVWRNSQRDMSWGILEEVDKRDRLIIERCRYLRQ